MGPNSVVGCIYYLMEDSKHLKKGAKIYCSYDTGWTGTELFIITKDREWKTVRCGYAADEAVRQWERDRSKVRKLRYIFEDYGWFDVSQPGTKMNRKGKK